MRLISWRSVPGRQHPFSGKQIECTMNLSICKRAGGQEKDRFSFGDWLIKRYVCVQTIYVYSICSSSGAWISLQFRIASTVNGRFISWLTFSVSIDRSLWWFIYIGRSGLQVVMRVFEPFSLKPIEKVNIGVHCQTIYWHNSWIFNNKHLCRRNGKERTFNKIIDSLQTSNSHKR